MAAPEATDEPVASTAAPDRPGETPGLRRIAAHHDLEVFGGARAWWLDLELGPGSQSTCCREHAIHGSLEAFSWLLNPALLRSNLCPVFSAVSSLGPSPLLCPVQRALPHPVQHA